MSTKLNFHTEQRAATLWRCRIIGPTPNGRRIVCVAYADSEEAAERVARAEWDLPEDERSWHYQIGKG